jgi:hypothetical protein
MPNLYKFAPCVIAIMLSACTADVPFSWTEPESPSNEIPVFEADFDTSIHEYDGSTATDAANDIVGTDKSFYWEANKFTEKVTVTFSGNTANVESSVSGLITHINGAYITLDMASNSVKNIEITVQGKTDNGALKIYGKNKFKLTLNGAEITSQCGPAINDQCKKRVFLHLADGTINKLSDQTVYSAEPYYASGSSFDTEDAKGCLFSEGNIIVSGAGSLLVDAYHKHGIATDGYFWMRPGATLAVTHAAKNAIHAKGSANENIGIVINGGYIYANVDADGGKCLKTDNNIIINSGYLSLNTSGTTYFDAEENDTSSSTCIKSDMSTAIHGGAIVLKSIGDGAKGINADANIYITGGELYSYSLGRNFAADESIEISGGKTYSFSQNEHAIYAPTIDISNGYIIDISANNSLTAPQQKSTINGGYVFAYGNDATVNPDSSSKQAYVRHSQLSTQSSKSIAVSADNKCLIGFTADFTEPNELPALFSAPELTRGTQYTLSTGGTVSNCTSDWQGLFTGGSYSNAQSTETITAE